MPAQAFLRFSDSVGRLSKVMAEIPHLDTSHDGVEFCLTSGDWVCSASPILNDGHEGIWDISMRFGEGRWTRIKAVFKDGVLISTSPW